MPFVLDSSAALTWLFKDEATDATRALLTKARSFEQMLVPAHWTVEVVNVLLMAERRGRIGTADLDLFMTELSGFAVASERAPSMLAATTVRSLAVQHRLTAYDAAYLELALRRRLPLATLDTDLASAARAENVPLLL